MNIPYYGLNDFSAVWKRFDTDPHVLPQIYLMAGFPFHYHKLEIFADGTSVARDFETTTLMLNSLFCAVSVVSVPLLTQRRSQTSIKDLFVVLLLFAVVLAIQRSTVNVVYYYITPMIYFAPVWFGIPIALWPQLRKRKQNNGMNESRVGGSTLLK